VRVYRERFLHAKLYTVDDKAYAGSANMTCNALEGLGLVGGVV
jgi:phosphatidylserine/phosphatidylglycerophosphate/cardiolipin synthase-like enzyme